MRRLIAFLRLRQDIARSRVLRIDACSAAIGIGPRREPSGNLDELGIAHVARAILEAATQCFDGEMDTLHLGERGQGKALEDLQRLCKSKATGRGQRGARDLGASIRETLNR